MTTEISLTIPGEDERLGPEVPDAVLSVVGMPTTVEDAYHVRNNLGPFMRAVFAYRDWLDRWISEDMAERGAKERVVDGITYTFEGDSTWVVDEPQAMLTGLADLMAAGEMTSEDFEGVVSIVQPEPVIKINHTKLNTLAKRRGGKVAETIEKHRRKVESLPKLRMKS